MRTAIALCMLVGLPLGGCLSEKLTSGDGDTLVQHGAGLSHCQEVGRASSDGGHLAAYDDCVKEGGL